MRSITGEIDRGDLYLCQDDAFTGNLGFQGF